MRCRGLIALLIWGQSVAAADLGTWGDLWPVKEPDMLTVIMQRLTALEQSGELLGIPGHVCHTVSRQGNLSDLRRQSCLYPGVTPVHLLLRRRCLSA